MLRSVHCAVFINTLGRSSTAFSAQLTACLRDLARHFKTDPTETVALSFGISENTVFSNGIDSVSFVLQ
jgi:hypothetical protein